MELVKKKLQKELEGLEEELHFKLPKEIQKAREFGDGAAVDRADADHAASPTAR